MPFPPSEAFNSSPAHHGGVFLGDLALLQLEEDEVVGRSWSGFGVQHTLGAGEVAEGDAVPPLHGRLQRLEEALLRQLLHVHVQQLTRTENAQQTEANIPCTAKWV